MTTGRRWRVLVPVVAAALAGVVLAWVLRWSSGFPAAALARVLADGAGATVLGLAALPRLDHRLAVAWRPVAVLATVWLAAEFTVLVCEAADIVGVPVRALGAGEFATFLGRLSGGQIGIAILFCTAAIACYAAWAFRRPDDASADLVLVFAAVALALRPITGHMSQQVLGSVLVAVHALAAAAWFGLLLALALVVRTRGGWASALPRYSTAAAPLVAVLAVTGLVDGLVRVGSVPALVTTGYGRILLAKVVALGLLAGLGWWWRRTWVRRAAEHRVTAEVSARNAALEVTLMAVAFGLAATLAVTA
ncbi:CopD family protein [Nocardia caishijiensis]|uniref:Copper resistance protein D n=1 Tax=Nocardia caishijiensis TaxID=184756 RepID=A0ABQ6YUV5_9NOCA|nr:CopD family protein [Nocardia caishijiensis]KAF0849585.1 putative copper resistance protein D [Nocardia caishijiensis]